MPISLILPVSPLTGEDAFELDRAIEVSLLNAAKEALIEAACNGIAVAVGRGRDTRINASTVATPEIKEDVRDRFARGKVNEVDGHIKW